jgi:hypothetical protein
LLIGQLVWNPPEWLAAWWIVRTASAAVGHVIARVIRSHLNAGDGDLDGDIGAAARLTKAMSGQNSVWPNSVHANRFDDFPEGCT